VKQAFDILMFWYRAMTDRDGTTCVYATHQISSLSLHREHFGLKSRQVVKISVGFVSPFCCEDVNGHDIGNDFCSFEVWSPIHKYT
jgi:hypothetical protein